MIYTPLLAENISDFVAKTTKFRKISIDKTILPCYNTHSSTDAAGIG
jgi:hypothetical protein